MLRNAYKCILLSVLYCGQLPWLQSFIQDVNLIVQLFESYISTHIRRILCHNKINYDFTFSYFEKYASNF